MRKLIYSCLFILSFGTFYSCEVFDLDVEDSPNSLTPSKLDPDLVLNDLEVTLGAFYEESTEFGMEVTRQISMFGPLYTTAYIAQSFDDTWEYAYAGIFADANLLIPYAEARDLHVHAGIAKIIKAYTAVTLVDYFGDIPYNDATLGAGNLNPGLTDGAVVYDSAFVLLDEAIADLKRVDEAATLPATDLYYGGTEDFSEWIRVANSLKLKMLVTTRKVNPDAASEIKALVNNAEFISSADEDWQFPWSTNEAAPDARHPQYVESYVNKPVGMDYLGNYFMNLLIETEDPRLRYYFYRQVNEISSDVNELPCITQTRPAHFGPDDVFCALEGGFWGRDHGNDDGIPPDADKRTVYGVYPVGGMFDANQDATVNAGDGAGGAGVSPYLLASFVDFWRAEAALTLNTGENARELLESGIRESIAKVVTFNNEIGYALPAAAEAFVPTPEEITEYIESVLEAYDAATPQGKLEIIITQLYIAAYENGPVAYNAYRRTGYPADFQPTLAPNPGEFILSFSYPSVFVNRNSSVSQKPNQTVPVFWYDESVQLD